MHITMSLYFANAYDHINKMQWYFPIELVNTYKPFFTLNQWDNSHFFLIIFGPPITCPKFTGAMQCNSYNNPIILKKILLNIINQFLVLVKISFDLRNPI